MLIDPLSQLIGYVCVSATMCVIVSMFSVIAARLTGQWLGGDKPTKVVIVGRDDV